MFRIPVLLLCVLLSTPVAAANRLRLVLDSGWIIPLSGDGKQLAGEAVKLDLPKGTKSIFAFSIDYPHDRLYVTPDGPYATRGTVVFALSSLRRLGFMLGVTEVTIPVDPKAPWFVAQTYTTDSAEMGRSMASLEQLRAEIANGVKIELRERGAWGKVRQHKTGPLSLSSIALWQCYSSKRKEFLTAGLYSFYDLETEYRSLPKAQTLEGRRKLIEEHGFIKDCWENGDALLTRDEVAFAKAPQENRRAIASKYSEKGGLKQIVSDGKWRFRAYHGVAIALGRESRYAAYLSYPSSSMLFDFHEMKVTWPPMIGNARFAQLSANRNEWYVPDVSYSYRGNEDWMYIEGAGESGRFCGSRLVKLSVSGEPVVDDIEFPPQISEIITRQGDIAALHYSDDLTDEEKQQKIDALAPLGPLGQKIPDIAILGAIAD